MKKLLLHYLLVLSLPVIGLAQYYDEYAGEEVGPTTFQKIMTGSAATLIMVLLGSAGLFNLIFTSGKGQKSEKQQLVGAALVLCVIAMAWYRFALWSDPSYVKQ